MDIVAHTLWAAVGVAALRRRRAVATGTAVATLAMAALPDVLHMMPVTLWWLLGDGTLTALWTYATALPGQEPALPPSVLFWSHQAHCVMHSAIVAGAVTLLLWAVRRTLWIPLLGWWSHIVIDVFTHSAQYYAAPVLYPITDRGFDGIAWNTPWFMALNYAALAAIGLWLAWQKAGSRRER